MESIQISATAGAMIGNAPSRSNRLSSSFRLQTLQTSLGLPYRPDRYSRDPAADGVVGQATADTASFLDMELCLPGSEAERVPGCNIGMGGSQRKCSSAIIAMSPLHRGPSPGQTRFWRTVRSQTIAGVSCLAVGRRLPAGRAVFRAHWGGRPTITSGDAKWRPSAGAADEHRHIASGSVSRSCAGSGRRASSIVQHRGVGAPFHPYP